MFRYSGNPYLYDLHASGQRRLRPDRYEFLVYRLLRNGVEAGDIFCRDSVRFRSFEDDLIDNAQWQDKDHLIEQTGLKSLTQPIREHLAELEERLEQRLIEVNAHITSGENEHFEIKRRGAKSRWTLKYPRNTEPVNAPFFDALTQVDIGSVVHFVQQHCPFMEAFDHVLGRYARQTIDPHILTACLMAWGTNMGLGRMADACDIDYQDLVRALSQILVCRDSEASFPLPTEPLRGESVELFGRTAALLTPVDKLPFAQHVHQFDTG